MKRHGLRGLLLATAFALSACGGGGGSSAGSSTTPTPPPTVPTQTGTVAGTVFANGSNQAISNALLQFGSVTASTSSTGAYSMTLPVGSGQVIKITEPNHADYIARVDVTANGTAVLQVLMTPVGISSPPSTSIANPSAVTLSGSTAQVTLPPNGLVDAITGAPASGNVTIKLTEIDPSQNTQAMPAGFLARTTGGTQAFESFGVVQVDLLSSTGRKLQLASSKTATIRIPVNASASTPPSSIGLFSLNETTGLWTQEGTATLVGSGASAYYQATVSHFSYWSVGRLINTVVVSGQVCNADGSALDPTANTTEAFDVLATGTDYIGGSFATVASDGSFSLTVKQNAETDVQLVNRQQEPLDFESVSTEASNKSLSRCLRLPAIAPELPKIATQPQTQSVALNASAVLTVALSNAAQAAPVSYQWYQDGVAIENATNASYTTPVFSNTATSRSYYVEISNDTGTATSTTAVLTVSAPTNTADEATIRKVARFVPLNTIADNLGNGFNFLVNNSSSATVLPSITYDPFLCAPYRGTTIQVNGTTLQQYQKTSFSPTTSYALRIQFPSPECKTSRGLGELILTGSLSTTFSYTGVNTPQSYNYTHDFNLSNASITSSSQAMQASGSWHMFEERKANTTVTSRTFEPRTGASLSDLATDLTATVSAGQIKTEVNQSTQGTTTTVTYVTPTTITSSGVAYTASGQYTLSVSDQGVVSHTGALLLKRNGSTVAEVYPNDAGTGLVVKVNNGVPSAL